MPSDPYPYRPLEWRFSNTLNSLSLSLVAQSLYKSTTTTKDMHHNEFMPHNCLEWQTTTATVAKQQKGDAHPRGISVQKLKLFNLWQKRFIANFMPVVIHLPHPSPALLLVVSWFYLL